MAVYKKESVPCTLNGLVMVEAVTVAVTRDQVSIPKNTHHNIQYTQNYKYIQLQ